MQIAKHVERETGDVMVSGYPTLAVVVEGAAADEGAFLWLVVLPSWRRGGIGRKPAASRPAEDD